MKKMLIFLEMLKFFTILKNKSICNIFEKNELKVVKAKASFKMKPIFFFYNVITV